jgi:hypothetical protein
MSRQPDAGSATPVPIAAAAAGPADGIDPRSPRFGAGITAVLLLVTIVLGLAGLDIAAFIVLLVISLLFAWGAFAGIRLHPYGALFRAVVRPRIGPPADREDPAPPTFAQGVGSVITLLGLVLALFGVPYAVVIAAALAFVAAFLNAVFGYCLGCQIYLLLVRAGVIRRARSDAA